MSGRSVARIVYWSLVCLLLTAQGVIKADQVPPRVLGGPFPTFRSVAVAIPAPMQPLIQGGIPANPANYPASFYANTGIGSCTATLIEQSSLLTAAHCVPNNNDIKIDWNGGEITGTCTHASGYDPNSPVGMTDDYALCRLSQPIKVAFYDRLNLDPSKLAVGDKIQLTGFGCTEPDRTGGQDGVFRYAFAQIIALPAGNNNDVIVNPAATGGGALCPGDSGGPSYKTLHLGGQDRLRIIAVNSRIALASGGGLGNISYLASTSSPQAQAFFTSWAAQNGNPHLCGIDPMAINCRP